jgi:hypothetical protein
MTTVLWLIFIQGIIGAFDTFYYHEYRARLPARGRTAAPELKLHAARDFLYAILFTSIPWFQWRGAWAAALAAVIVAEIILTLWDFVAEIAVRKELGDVYAGERITHALMGIIYGGMVAYLIPVMLRWWSLGSALAFAPAAVPALLRWTITLMGIGVLLSGIRDLYAALNGPGGNWPWKVQITANAGSPT